VADEYVHVTHAEYVRELELVREQIEQSHALVRQARELMQRSREGRTKLDQVWQDRPRGRG